MESMKRLIKYFISLSVLFAISGMYANGQSAEKEVSANDSPELRAKIGHEKYVKKGEYTKDYQSLPTEDPLLEIRNISFQRRVAPSARGELLDVQFNLFNKDVKTKEYAVYVLAVNESNVPIYYPSNWRTNDPQKGMKYIRFQKLSPDPEWLKEEDVFTAVSTPEVVKYYQEKDKNAVLEGTLRRVSTDPNLDDYLMYLTKNRDKALRVKVYGIQAPEDGTSLSTNRIVKEEELKRDVNYEAEKQTYTVQNNKYFTTITSHHFSIYRPDYLFFNKVVILVFDLERPKNQLIFRSIHNIGNMKMRI